jgi:capsular exopolysaccharide synthesis family protein
MSEYLLDSGPEIASAGGEGALQLRRILTASRHRWWIVAGIFGTILGGTMWYTARQPRIYRTVATVRVSDADAQVSSGFQTPQYRDYRIDPIQSEQEIIKSAALSERVARALGLRVLISGPKGVSRDQVFGDSVPRVSDSAMNGPYALLLRPDRVELRQGSDVLGSALYGSPLRAAGIELTVPRRLPHVNQAVTFNVISSEAAAARVRGGLTTRNVPQTNIIEIAYQGTDPALVQDIADGVATGYALWATEQKRNLARMRTQFIESSLREQALALNRTTDALKGFKEREQLSDVGSEQAALVQSIHKFQDDLDAALVEQQVYRKLIGGLTEADTATDELQRLAGTQAVVNNDYISNLYTRWYDYLKQREELYAKNQTDQADEIKGLNRLISRTKDDLRAASGLYLQGLEGRIQSLQATIAKLRQETEKYPSLEAQQARLQGDVRTVQSVYDQLQSELQRARINENGEVGNVRVVDHAVRPTRPISPNRRRMLMTAVIFGLLLGFGAAVLAENLDDTVKSVDQMREQLGVPVLGTIPRIADAARGAERGDADRLVTQYDPRSPVAEAYRSLRTNLAFARANHEMRSIVLTSPGPADGKSTTVSNLAITFAQQGQRTLLIDADLRRAVLNKVFEVERSPGLTDVLVGNSLLADVVQETKVPNLFVLGSGRFPPNPAELLGSSAMRVLLEEAEQRFDVVLLDSPPVLAVTDAAVLSTIADGVVLVVRVGSTVRAAAERSASQLQAVHGRLVGTVMNDIDFRQRAFGGTYGYYYYYYYYGSETGRNGHTLMGRLANWRRRRRPAAATNGKG